MPPDSPTDDSADVHATLAGDREAFGRLYDRHARRVRAIVAAVSGDWAAVEDLTQETFLRTYTRLGRLRDPRRFGPWIDGFARLVARERRRQASRDRHEFPGETPESLANGGPESGAILSEEVQKIMRALSGLGERERLAVHAYFFLDQNADEAADSIGLSRSAYYALLKRTLARLQKALSAPEHSATE